MHDVWPVLFVAYRSKADDALESLRQGTLSAPVSTSAHIRRGARFILTVEDGRVLGTGEVVKAFKEKQELSVRFESADAATAPALPKPLLEKLKALLGSGPRPPLLAFVIPTGGKGAAVDVAWFDEVTALAERADASGAAGPSAPERAGKDDPSGPASLTDDLLEWLPPKLAPLTRDDVRADGWEQVVAAAFRALGLSTKELGQSCPGDAVPDCVARFESLSGPYVLVVDAKRGTWNAPVDALRAMRDYVIEHGGPAGYPVFVVGGLGDQARERLAKANFGPRDPVVLTGRQLAEAIVRRLTEPEQPLEAELKGLLRAGRV